MKHTPGPWHLGTSADHTPAICVAVPASEGTGFVVASVNRIPRLSSVGGDMDANARLIAKAPTLLEAALQVLAHVGKHGEIDSRNVLIELLGAAVDDATGLYAAETK
jgi:hypothetical protein